MVCFPNNMDEKIRIIERDKNQSVDDFYRGFKEKLEKEHTFPTNYIFKFIFPAEQSNVAKLHTIFEKANASFSSRDSKNGRYTSITINAFVNDADDIIIYYRQVASIAGVVML